MCSGASCLAPPLSSKKVHLPKNNLAVQCSRCVRPMEVDTTPAPSPPARRAGKFPRGGFAPCAPQLGRGGRSRHRHGVPAQLSSAWTGGCPRPRPPGLVALQSTRSRGASRRSCFSAPPRPPWPPWTHRHRLEAGRRRWGARAQQRFRNFKTCLANAAAHSQYGGRDSESKLRLRQPAHDGLAGAALYDRWFEVLSHSVIIINCE